MAGTETKHNMTSTEAEKDEASMRTASESTADTAKWSSGSSTDDQDSARVPDAMDHGSAQDDASSEWERDAANPLNWPLYRKWSIVIMVATMFMLSNFGTITIVPAVPQVVDEFALQDTSLYSTLLVTVWELGEGIGPFLVGPLSELYGRQPIYHSGNLLCVIFSVAAALSTNIHMLIAFRFLTGFATTSLTLGPSIVGDLFRKEERGSAMAVAIAMPLLGPFAAPVVGAYVNERLGWRWTIWINVIAVGTVSALSLLLFKETYKPKILRKRGGERASKEEQWKVFVQSISRPVRMLLSPIVLVISLCTAYVYGVSFVILTTLTELLESVYAFGEGPVGLAFLGRAIGNVVGMALYGLTSDRYIRYCKARDGGTLRPERRLLHMVLGLATFPVGMFLYAWTLQPAIHWIVPLTGTAIVGFSMLLTILPTENYLVDAFDEHGASAVSAGVILRALFGAILPLAGPPLYQNLGIGWGNSVLGFIGVAFLPLIVLLWRCGPRMREKSGSLTQKDIQKV